MALSKSANHQQLSAFLSPETTSVRLDWENIDLLDKQSIRFSKEFGTSRIGLKLRLQKSDYHSTFSIWLIVTDKTAKTAKSPNNIKAQLRLGEICRTDNEISMKKFPTDRKTVVLGEEDTWLVVQRFEMNKIGWFNINNDFFSRFVTLEGEVSLNEYTCSPRWSVNPEQIMKRSKETLKSDPLIVDSMHSTVLCQQLVDAYKNIETDVTLKTVDPDGSERLFDAHKFVLRMRSPFFAGMLVSSHFAEGHKAAAADKNSGDKDEDKGDKPEAKPEAKPVLELHNISGEVMEAMLDYFYGRPNDNWKSIACDLALAADMYRVQELVDVCLDSLMLGLNAENAARTMVVADSVNAPDSVRTSIGYFMLVNLDQVTLNEEWQQITMERGAGWMKECMDDRPPKKQRTEETSKDGDDSAPTASTSAVADMEK